jgi:putative phosphoesterase
MSGRDWLVGVISDTHGLLRRSAREALAGADLIVHAGDIGKPEVLSELASIASVVAVRGNVDRGAWAEKYPTRQFVAIGGVSLYVLHDLKELAIDPLRAGYSLVISGHSHQPHMEERAGVVYLNPGSAGPRRFDLPIGCARIFIRAGQVRAELVDLANDVDVAEPGKRKPTRTRRH